MRILWFTNTSSLYEQDTHAHYGGGWIESLETLLAYKSNIELAVSFFHKTDSKKSKKGNTTYYPIKSKARKNNPLKYIVENWQGKIEDAKNINLLIEVINDFKPNLIHVFGTEGVFSSIQHYTNIPIVIQLQGIINPCVNAFFPPNLSKWDFIFSHDYFLDNILGRSPVFTYLRFLNQAKREKENLKSAKYLIGRTEWDKSISLSYNRNATYFHIDEVLRPIFYTPHNKKENVKKEITIISTISPTIYKGIDVILKSAKILKEDTDIKFQWKLIGLSSEDKLLKIFEKNLNINHRLFNIECLGNKRPEDLSEILKKADVFIHPSYIDNSPNSICEAQILGLLVIASNVGGIASLVSHKKSGILIPANGVFEIISYLKNYMEKKDEYMLISQNGKKIATERHNQNKILMQVLNSYSEILNN